MFLKQLLISLLVTSAAAAEQNFASRKAHELVELAKGFIKGATEAEYRDIIAISLCLQESKILFNDTPDVVHDFAEHPTAKTIRALKVMGRMSSDLLMML
jgi:hypothetical protein